MSAQASGKAVEHEWLMRENSNGHLRGKCSCGEPAMGLMTRDAWYAHLSYLRAEQAANPVASSAHFPRITKHDLEVVVEAMDKLREALRADDRELVENLEGLAEKWEKENSLRSDDSYRYPQQLRAVLAARNKGGTK